jgi:hypothetical protein
LPKSKNEKKIFSNKKKLNEKSKYR